jgi:hypothetical protein
MSTAQWIAGIVLVSEVLLTPLAHAADDSVNEDARKHFKAGVSLLQDPDGARYEDAYREFQAAYAASPSPKILGNIGYCALKLERDGEALVAYTRYLQEVSDIEPALATQILRDVATLRTGLVRVTLTVDSPDAMVVDKRLHMRGDLITNLYGPVKRSIELGLRAGHHVIEMKVGGETMSPWEFDANPGAILSHALVSRPAEPLRRPSSNAMPWIVTGIGGAALAVGGIVGAVTLSKVHAIGDNCPNNQCPSTYALKPAQESVRRLVPITDAFLIGGGVVAATGLWLLLWGSGGETLHSPAAERAASAHPVVACSPLGCIAAFSGRF